MYAPTTSLTTKTESAAKMPTKSKQHPTMNNLRSNSGPKIRESDPRGSMRLNRARTGSRSSGSRFGASRPLPTGRDSALRTGNKDNMISTSPWHSWGLLGWNNLNHLPSVAPSNRLNEAKVSANDDLSSTVASVAISLSGEVSTARMSWRHIEERGIVTSPMASFALNISRSNAEMRSAARATGISKRKILRKLKLPRPSVANQCVSVS
mmetsp:Transcript_4870/g.10630  ORF Transcript_4870/g.10630 Transcript_4870/m.10630 type:complete len:209 (-) Transcript_4870:5099-5725(-)